MSDSKAKRTTIHVIVLYKGKNTLPEMYAIWSKSWCR